MTAGLHLLCSLAVAASVTPCSGIVNVVRRESLDPPVQAVILPTGTIVQDGRMPSQDLLSSEAEPNVLTISHEATVQKVAQTSAQLPKHYNLTSVSIPPLTSAVLAATLLIVGIIVFLYGSKGPWVVAKVLTYLLALATMKAVVKLVEINCSFKFPLFLTSTHFIAGWCVAFTVLKYNSKMNGEEFTVPSLQCIGARFVPISLAFAGSIAMSNIALVHSTTAFVEIVSASGPIVTVAITLLMKQPFDVQLLGPCFLVFVGCALTSNGEPHFSMIGLALATGANIPRAIKTVLQQLLLQNDLSSQSFKPMDVLAWTCVPSSLAMLVWSLAQEGTQPYHQWYAHGFFSSLTFFVLLSCINACILNTAILFVIKDLGAVGTQIVAQTKSILVVLGGACFLNEQVSRLEILGFMLVMIGVYTYNDIESRFKAKNKSSGLKQQLQGQTETAAKEAQSSTTK